MFSRLLKLKSPELLPTRQHSISATSPGVISKASCAVIQQASPEEVPEVSALSTLHLANPLPKGDAPGY